VFFSVWKASSQKQEGRTGIEVRETTGFLDLSMPAMLTRSWYVEIVGVQLQNFKYRRHGV
jgi:hypothetical protein